MWRERWLRLPFRFLSAVAAIYTYYTEKSKPYRRLPLDLGRAR